MTSWFHAAGYDYQEFTANGLRTFAVVEGQSSAFPLVLLHSIPAASFVWSTTIQAVGRSTRVIAPDFPGWGRSHNRIQPVEIQLKREFLRDWLQEVISAQQCVRCDVAGLGDGAWLALDFVAAYPEKVRRLGLLNLPLVEQSSLKPRWPWQKSAWNRGQLGKWLTSQPRLSEPLKQQFEELFAGGWHVERSPEFPSAEFHRENKALRDSLRKFDGEVLLGWGKKSRGFDEKLAGELAQGRSVTIWGESGEFPMWEQPEQYTSEMREFFGT